jgi:hypothetical protein
MKSNELSSCSGNVLISLLCIYIHKEWKFSIFFFLKNALGLESDLCLIPVICH